MSLLRTILKVILTLYLIYIFVFSFIIYYFHPATEADNPLASLDPSPDQPSQDRVALIEKPEDGLTTRLAILGQANERIDVSYYKLVGGQAGDLFLGALYEAAQSGVQVRILLDGVVNLANRNSEVEKIFRAFSDHPNMAVRLYEPFRPLLPHSWHNRMHDKMILVDDQFALLGGRNIEDRFYLEENFGNGFVYDRDVLVYHKESSENSPTVIQDMRDYHEKVWDHPYVEPAYPAYSTQSTHHAEDGSSSGSNEFEGLEGSKVPELPEESKTSEIPSKKMEEAERSLGDLKERYAAFKVSQASLFTKASQVDWQAVTLPAEGVYFVSNPIGRLNVDPVCLKALLSLAQGAKEEILLQSPYTIPTASLRKLYQAYPGIDPSLMTLLTNSEAASPNLFGIAGYVHYRPRLLSAGMSIHEYGEPGSLHAKSAVFDRTYSMVGTFNLDPRSAYLDTESMLIINSEPFAQMLASRLEVLMDQSHTLTSKADIEDARQDLSTIKRILIRITSFLTPIFGHLL